MRRDGYSPKRSTHAQRDRRHASKPPRRLPYRPSGQWRPAMLLAPARRTPYPRISRVLNERLLGSFRVLSRDGEARSLSLTSRFREAKTDVRVTCFLMDSLDPLDERVVVRVDRFRDPSKDRILNVRVLQRHGLKDARQRENPKKHSKRRQDDASGEQAGIERPSLGRLQQSRNKSKRGDPGERRHDPACGYAYAGRSETRVVTNIGLRSCGRLRCCFRLEGGFLRRSLFRVVRHRRSLSTAFCPCARGQASRPPRREDRGRPSR